MATVKLDAPVGPGETHSLGTIGVSNPGTIRSSYKVTVVPLAAAGGRDIDPSWIRFSPATFTLDPGGTQPVAVTLVVPPDAAAVDYAGLIEASVVADGSSGTLSISPGAGAKLTFTVRPASTIAGWLAAAGTWLAAVTPWPQLVVAALVLLLAARWVARRWNIRIERRG